MSLSVLWMLSAIAFITNCEQKEEEMLLEEFAVNASNLGKC